MEVKFLVYHGNRENGKLSVRGLDVLSPFRKIEFYKGMRWEVGRIIPLNDANIIARDYPSIFKIETKKYNDLDGYVLQFSNLMEECLAMIGDESSLSVVQKIVDKYFEDYSVKKKIRRAK